MKRNPVMNGMRALLFAAALVAAACAGSHDHHVESPAAVATDSAAPPAADAHDHHAGMHHPEPAAPAEEPDPHAHHRAAPAEADPHTHHHGAASAETPDATAPRSDADMRNLQPAATLQPDVFDAPAPSSVREAEKARHAGHEGHGAKKDQR